MALVPRSLLVIGRRNSAGIVLGSTPGVVLHYLNMPAGGGASTPDKAALNSGTAVLDFRVKIAPTSWASGSLQGLMQQQGTAATSRWYFALLQTGTLFIKWWGGGAVEANHTSTVSASTIFAAGQIGWVRALVTITAGTTDFYTSIDDGGSWQSLGTQVTGGGTTALNNTTPPSVFTGADGAAVLAGKLYRSRLLIGGVSTLDMDFSAQVPGNGPWTAATGEVWTRTGTSAVV